MPDLPRKTLSAHAGVDDRVFVEQARAITAPLQRPYSAITLRAIVYGESVWVALFAFLTPIPPTGTTR